MSEISLQKFYSDDECERIYGLARYFLEVGQFRNAETIFRGLVAVRPEYLPGWLGLCYLLSFNHQYDDLLDTASRARKILPEDPAAQLFEVIALFGTGDIPAAGTLLGEVGEILQQNPPQHPDIIRIYRSQLARYQNG